MTLKTQRRISAQILKVGKNRVVFDPTKLEDIKAAITKSDIRSLINKKVIKARPLLEQSRARARKIAEQKRKNLRKNQGSRKGKKNARLNQKRVWITRIRLQRRLLRELKTKDLLSSKTCRALLAKAKGGVFRSKRHLKLHILEHNLIEKK